MESPNPLSKLALEYWYQVIMVVSVAVFLLNGTGLLKQYPSTPTALISLGSFFIGLGEWVNHPLQTTLAHGGIITGHPRSMSSLGVLFLITGLCLVTYGIYRLL